MNSTLLTGGDFFMLPKKGQAFTRYSEEIKKGGDSPSSGGKLALFDDHAKESRGSIIIP